MKSMPDFGTVHENAAAFDVAVAALSSGEIAWGRSLLAVLRNHICSTGEHKSVQWMLPQVLETLAALTTCPPSSGTGQGGAQDSGRGSTVPTLLTTVTCNLTWCVGLFVNRVPVIRSQSMAGEQDWGMLLCSVVAPVRDPMAPARLRGRLHRRCGVVAVHQACLGSTHG